YDPDDLDLPASRQATVATAATATGLPAIAPRIRVSVMPELKELSGKDDDEGRARASIGKVKSASSEIRPQTTRNAWCLVACSLDQRVTGSGNLVILVTAESWESLCDKVD
ncbi:hypothetical protein F442_14351, partial [Phytophthora nicotianae P10297]